MSLTMFYGEFIGISHKPDFKITIDESYPYSGDVMFGINLDRKSQKSLPRQIYHSIVSLVLGSNLQAGIALPSTREMAKSLGVSRNTVAEAYELLRTEGYITCRQSAVCRISENLALRLQKNKQTATPRNFLPAYKLHGGFKFKVQHPVLGYWRLLKKLHRVS